MCSAVSRHVYAAAYRPHEEYRHIPRHAHDTHILQTGARGEPRGSIVRREVNPRGRSSCKHRYAVLCKSSYGAWGETGTGRGPRRAAVRGEIEAPGRRSIEIQPAHHESGNCQAAAAQASPRGIPGCPVVSREICAIPTCSSKHAPAVYRKARHRLGGERLMPAQSAVRRDVHAVAVHAGKKRRACGGK